MLSTVSVIPGHIYCIKRLWAAFLCIRSLEYQIIQKKYQTKNERWHKNKSQLENQNMGFLGGIGPNMGHTMEFMGIMDFMD